MSDVPPTSTPPMPASRWKRSLRKILKISLCVYIGLAIVFYFLQTWMIFPGASSQGKREAAVHPAPDQQLVPLTTASGEKIYVLFSPALTASGSAHPDAAHRPTIL